MIEIGSEAVRLGALEFLIAVAAVLVLLKTRK